MFSCSGRVPSRSCPQFSQTQASTASFPSPASCLWLFVSCHQTAGRGEWRFLCPLHGPWDWAPVLPGHAPPPCHEPFHGVHTHLTLSPGQPLQEGAASWTLTGMLGPGQHSPVLPQCHLLATGIISVLELSELVLHNPEGGWLWCYHTAP